MDVFLLSCLVLLHPIYGVYLLFKKKYLDAMFRIVLPFVTLSCLNLRTIGYRSGQSSLETFRQSLMEGNVIAYLGVLSAFLWLICILMDVRNIVIPMSNRSDIK